MKKEQTSAFKERVYKQMKAEEFLPGVIRWRVGAFNEHVDKMDRIRYVTPDNKTYVLEYRTHSEKSKTYSDVFDIFEIDPMDQLISG